MNLYRDESSYPKVNAQRNLCGRTHYVDDDTLRWHKSRVISTHVTDGGLLFAIVTSDALDMNNARRGFRYVVFNLFGAVLGRTDMESAYRTSDQARKVMWTALNAIDAKAVTLKAIADVEAQHARDMVHLRATIAKLAADKLVA
jgi:hypothetical protein